MSTSIDVKDKYGRILASIVTDDYGNKTVKDKYGRILGSYNKNQDLTKDKYGRIVASGDQASLLISLREDD